MERARAMRVGKVPREVYGELSEWLKEHDWKSCIREKRIPGSNPGLSAIFEPVLVPASLRGHALAYACKHRERWQSG